METEKKCEALAVKTIEVYINSCDCDTVWDVHAALHKLIAVTNNAIDLVENGKKEVVQ